MTFLSPASIGDGLCSHWCGRSPAALFVLICSTFVFQRAAGEEDLNAAPEGETDPGDDVDASDDCWTYGGIDQISNGMISPGVCCRNSPCGVFDCWKPPELTFDFCCKVSACRPLAIGEIQRALLELSKLPVGVNITYLSRRTHSLAGFHLRTLHHQFHGVRLKPRLNDMLRTNCDCAIAVVAGALLQTDNVDFRVASPSWFAAEVEWGSLVQTGWGPLFHTLASRNRHVLEKSSEGTSLQKAVEALESQVKALSSIGDLYDFLDAAQSIAQLVASMTEDRKLGFDYFLSALHHIGLVSLVWARVGQDVALRRSGQRCSAVVESLPSPASHVSWSSCQPWSYSPDANFTSPQANTHWSGTVEPANRSSAFPLPSVGVCVLGAPRTVVETYSGIQKFVVRPLKADVFAYVPFSGILSHELERTLKNLGPIVTAIIAPDVDAEGMRKRFYSEVRDYQVGALYEFANGPYKAPLHGQMGSVMWSYFSQSICHRMVKAHEQQRGGKLYEWVIFARADMFWTREHPRQYVLDNRYVHVPFGQDNSFYNFGAEYGLNDRHAAIPRHLADAYLGRWEDFTDGKSWAYLKQPALRGELTNAEQFLLMHLRHNNVPVARFPPVSYLAMCVESPQCLHLYKGTTLRKRQWTYSAKYFPEVVEVIRTATDSLHGRALGWTWARVPLYDLGEGVREPWQMHSLEYACCLGPSGPVSCKWWDFMKQCRCIK